MEIGLIVSDRSFVSELEDLREAIKHAGHTPMHIDIDNISVEIRKGKITPYQMSAPARQAKLDPDCAILRHIGYIKDYEQFSQRIWSVKALEMNDIYVANNIKSWLQASDKLGALMGMAKQ